MDSQFQMPATHSLQIGLKKQKFEEASDQKFNVII